MLYLFIEGTTEVTDVAPFNKWIIMTLPRRQSPYCVIPPYLFLRRLQARESLNKKLLKEFDLSWQASLQDIKRVYRRKIKEVHPDSREREKRDLDSDESSDAFILLSKKYDRILELREQLDLK
jgi:hypothetical protein